MMKMRINIFNLPILSLAVLTDVFRCYNFQKSYYAKTLDTNDCGKTVMFLSPNRILHLIVYPSTLSRHLNARNQTDDCFFKIYLYTSVKSFHSKRNFDVSISLEKNRNCSFNLEVYSGPSRMNKPLTVLSCDDKPIWQNRLPSDHINLRFVPIPGRLENLDLAENIRTVMKYSLCGDCYRSKWKLAHKAKEITNHCGQMRCVDNSYIRYSNYESSDPMTFYDETKSLCPSCSTLYLDVIESVQICIQTKRSMGLAMTELKARTCDVKVVIDGELALTIKIMLWEEYCLPWSLKGKRVKLDFGSSQWNCSGSLDFCQVSVVTNATRESSGMCTNWSVPLIKTSTTTATTPLRTTMDINYLLHSSPRTDSDDYDDDDDDDGFNTKTMIIIIVIVSVVLIICGICYKKMATDRSRDEDDQNESGENELDAMRGQSNQESTYDYEDSYGNIQSHNLPPAYAHIISERPVNVESADTNDSSGHVVDNMDSWFSNNSITHTMQTDTGAGFNESLMPSDAMLPPPSYDEACKHYP